VFLHEVEGELEDSGNGHPELEVRDSMGESNYGKIPLIALRHINHVDR